VSHRKAIVLPARLVGVVRTDEASIATPPIDMPPAVASTPPDVDHVAQEREQARQLLARLAARVEQLNAARPPIEELRQAAVELGIAIASRLVYHQIAVGAFGIEQLVRGALEQLQTKHAAVVHLHPDDLALLHKRLGDLAALHAEQPVHWRADARLARGDCKVQAGDLGVWSSMHQRLQQVRAQLLEQLLPTS
jgi:flagellar biosynthesis/type III secretory pathway protein FliH